jgi:hypothetical protein
MFQSPDKINFGTIVISIVFLFGSIPSIKEPICPSISNVLVGVLEAEVVYATAVDGTLKLNPVME